MCVVFQLMECRADMRNQWSPINPDINEISTETRTMRFLSLFFVCLFGGNFVKILLLTCGICLLFLFLNVFNLFYNFCFNF